MSESDKQSFAKKELGAKSLLILIVLPVFIFVFFGFMSSFSSPKTTNPSSQPVANVPVVTKKWIKVAELSGDADKGGDTFTTQSDRLKVTYSFKGSDQIVGAVYIVPEGQERAQYIVNISSPTSDTTIVRKNPGKYYLKVKSLFASWTIVVEEEK